MSKYRPESESTANVNIGNFDDSNTKNSGVANSTPAHTHKNLSPEKLFVIRKCFARNCTSLFFSGCVSASLENINVQASVDQKRTKHVT